MRYILSLSYGKDSIATLEVIHRLGLPLDEVVHIEVMATKDISANLPEMDAFKKKVDRVIKERYGYEVKHISGKPFEEYFYKVKVRGKYKGKIYGFPISTVKGGWCMKYLKKVPFEEFMEDNKDNVTYLGIAIDERDREQKESRYAYPLIEAGWTEAMAYDWCKANDLLAPTYEHSKRDGCWFCPKQRVAGLRRLRKEYPEYWEKLLEWDKVSPVTFKVGKTLHDYDRRFRLEDECDIPTDRTFRWEMLDLAENIIQLKLFSEENN